jgi:hypothetical protein
MALFRRAWLAWLVMLALVAPAVVAHATTVLLLTREELVTRSDAVARVRVGGSQTSESDDGTAIVTRTELIITQPLKGALPATVVLEQIGGTYRGKTQRILGDASIASGEDLVVFLKKGDKGRVHLTALALAVYHVDAKGMARRDLKDLTLAKRERGRIRPTEAPKEAPEPVDQLMADVVRIAGGK